MKIKTGCLMAFLALSIISWADEKQSVSAKELFYARVQAAKASNQTRQKSPSAKKLNINGEQPTRVKTAYTLNTGLKYQLIQRSSNGNEVPVDPDSSFHSGDRIRLSFESNMKGYLYIVQQGSTGRWTVLFPDPRINDGKNTVDSGNQYLVPTSGWFLFDPNPGTERLMVFLSQQPMDSFPGLTKSIEPAGSTVNQSIVDELNNIKSQETHERRLIFEKDTSPGPDGSQPVPAAYAVNKEGKAVVAEIILKHN